jgi:hypothetical protein
MLTTKDRLMLELKIMIKEDYEKIRDNLAAGSAQNFDQYQRQVGKIQGLKAALEYIDEAEAIANGVKNRGE